ncbi:MAG: MlaD family protein [Planctomycetales bacterium]|nr:MlaD family protein [Planctomycetales bacterium]
MRPTRAEVLTGILVLATGGVGILFLLLLGRTGALTERATYVTFVRNTADLRARAAVHFEGNRAGDVSDVSWDVSRAAYRLTLRIPARLPVRADSRARIRAVGFLGDRFVEVSAGTPAAPVAPDGTELPGDEYVGAAESFGDLATDLRPALADLKGVLEGLRRLLEPGGAAGSLEATLAETKKAAESLARSADALQRILDDPDRGLGTLVSRANAIVEGPEGTLGAATRKLDAAAGMLEGMASSASKPLDETLHGAQRTMESLEETAGRLDKAVADLSAAVDKVARGADETLGGAGRMIRENEGEVRAAALAARAASEDLKRFAAKIAARPWTLLFSSDDEGKEAEQRRERDFEALLRERGRVGRHGGE